MDILGPVLTRFSDILEISPLAQPGLFHQLDQAYFKRIEAVDYTIKHDDGVGLATLDQAEIVLLGVSRTSKTHRHLPGLPRLEGRQRAGGARPMPEELCHVDPRRVVALTINPDRLQLIRRTGPPPTRRRPGRVHRPPPHRRRGRLRPPPLRRHGWPIVDVTFDSIEETATEAARIMFSHFGAKKDGLSEVLPEDRSARQHSLRATYI